MNRYHLALKVEGRRCVVVGGGAVGERKVEGLLGAGAAVELISPRVTAGLADLAAEGRIVWREREFEEGDAAGALLLFAATGDPGVNRGVEEAGGRTGALVNRADAPDGGDFLLPALQRDGEVTLAVDTGGSSPAMAAWLRDRLAGAVPAGAGRAAAVLGKVKGLRLAAGGREPYLAALEGGLCPALAAGDDEAAAIIVDGAFGPGTWDKLTEGVGK